MGTITINKLIGGSINIITGGADAPIVEYTIMNSLSRQLTIKVNGSDRVINANETITVTSEDIIAPRPGYVLFTVNADNESEYKDIVVPEKLTFNTIITNEVSENDW